MERFEIYAQDEVEFERIVYTRFLLGGGGPEHGMLNHNGDWFQYSREWFRPAVITPYVGSVEFDEGYILLDNY